MAAHRSALPRLSPPLPALAVLLAAAAQRTQAACCNGVTHAAGDSSCDTTFDGGTRSCSQFFESCSALGSDMS